MRRAAMSSSSEKLRSQILAKGYVRTERDQILTGFLVDVERSRSIFALRDQPRCLSALVDDIDLRPAIDEKLHHRRRPEIDAANDRRLPEIVGRVDVASELETVD